MKPAEPPLDEAGAEETAFRERVSRDELRADSKLPQAISMKLIQEENTDTLYEKIVDTAMTLMRAQYASMQTHHPERGPAGELRLVAFRGFSPGAAKFWAWVRPESQSTCGVALRTLERSLVSDVESCEWMADTEDLRTYRQTGIRAVQTTPLLSRGGKLVGMLSTHWDAPHQPSDHDLDLLDSLSRQAADLVERKHAAITLFGQESALRVSQRLAHVGSWTWDANTDATIGSDELFRIFGLDPATPKFPDFKAQLGTLYPPDSWDRLNRAMQETLASGVGYEVDLVALRGAERIWVTARGEAVRSTDGQVIGLRGTVQDINERKKTEEQLRRNHATFFNLIEAAPFGVYIVDADFRLAQVSAGSQKVFRGVNPLLGRDFAEVLRQIWAEPFASNAIAIFRHTLETGEPYASPDTTERRSDIDVVESYDWKIQRVTLPDGRFGVVCYFFDTTAQRQHEQAQARAAALDRFRVRLADALRPLSDAMAIQVQAARVLGQQLSADRVNYFKVVGTEYVLIQGYADRVPPLAGRFPVAAFSDNSLRMYKEGRTKVASDVQDDVNYSADQQAAFAKLQVAAYIAVPLVKDGEFVGGVAVHSSTPRKWRAEEISLVEEVAERTWAVVERIRTEAFLRESERRFRGTFENAAVGMAHLCLKGRWLRVNDKICAITGYSREELLTKSFADITHPEDVELDWSHARRLIAGDFPTYSIEKRYLRPDCSVIWINLTVSLLRDESGAPQNFISVIEDITQRKRAEEEARAASRAKDDFLAALSHELRTPLAPVMLTAASLESDETLPAETRQQMGMIRQNIELEARLIDDLLDLTKIARGKLQLRVATTDLHLLLEHTRKIVEHEAVEKNVALEFTLGAVHHQVEADPARMQQVLWNLLKNAVKFSPSGGRVLVTTENSVSGRVCVRVVDEGIGMTAAALNNIFQPFDQGDLNGRNSFGGLGLGFSISKAITDLHGGHLSASSPGLGRGSTFVVELKLSKSAVPKKLVPGNVPRVLTPLRLLVVEDHRPSLHAMVRLLERDGHTVHAASSVKEALVTVEEHVCDAVISDLGLPDGSGYDLMTLITNKRGWPGVALSGFGMDDDVARANKAGFVAHLTKPVALDKLRDEISRLASRSRSESNGSPAR